MRAAKIDWRTSTYFGMLMLLLLALLLHNVSSSPLPGHDDNPQAHEPYLYPVYNLKPQATVDVQESAVRSLLRRLVPRQEPQFRIRVQPDTKNCTEAFLIEGVGDKVQITATSGVTAAAGLYYYLKSFCGAHVSWSGKQLHTVPDILPLPKKPLTKTLNDKFRYYQNVCTASYSMVWWNWTRWEQEIDWMALNGINLPLAFTAQEEIWRRTYFKFGLRQSDLDTFFTGPAFLAWQRMGNLQGWAGPLPDSWHTQQVTLQHKVLKRMREFGMIPVLPSFAGHVPRAIERLGYKTSRLHWGKFDEKYGSTTFLFPNETLYHNISVTFLREYIKEFGTDHAYSADFFNEMRPPVNTPEFIRSCGRATFEALTAVDTRAVWLMQNWMFVNDKRMWTKDNMKALLTSVPLGRMIVLDLESELNPWYRQASMYFGQPFIWNMLHNFGGVLGMYGMLDAVNTGPFVARSANGSTMIGIGLTPEGIEQNDIIYAFMDENDLRTSPVNVDKWVADYGTRRYGRSNAHVALALRILRHSVYNATQQKNHGRCALTSRPGLRIKNKVWYSPKNVFDAWALLLEAANDSRIASMSTFRYDLVDVTRQSLQLLFERTYHEFVESFHKKSLDRLIELSIRGQQIMLDMEQILASDPHFLLGNWLEDAKRWGTTRKEVGIYEYNARNQISLWGPRGEVLDYAAKQWSGVFKGYYHPRWRLFFQTLVNCLIDRTPFNNTRFREDVFTVEESFTFQSDCYPTQPKGDSVSISEELHRQYMLPPRT
ncbi:alpha-N-acetylglucosaminidase-like isoform X2 [Ornithodoros turicata]|uniref:alpha-N-acetylglucosaminidase-like isoform X2 n=1 Tax=Ornithodoros turicata TaxID=34597 RepID=UPI003139ECEE